MVKRQNKAIRKHYSCKGFCKKYLRLRKMGASIVHDSCRLGNRSLLYNLVMRKLSPIDEWKLFIPLAVEVGKKNVSLELIHR
jgi:hypothetical protein